MANVRIWVQLPIDDPRARTVFVVCSVCGLVRSWAGRDYFDQARWAAYACRTAHQASHDGTDADGRESPGPGRK